MRFCNKCKKVIDPDEKAPNGMDIGDICDLCWNEITKDWTGQKGRTS